MSATAIRHLAKRRLAELGATAGGTDEVRAAALAVASELRLQSATEEQAREVIRRMLVLGATPKRQLLKQMERSASFAYQTETPILSGCCQDPRRHSGNTLTGKLRRSFAVYCDDQCARTCPMLRAIRNPGRSLYGTPYEPIDRSSLWMHGGTLGEAGHAAWRLIALLAVLLDTDEVQASGSYVSMKLDGAYSPTHLRKVMSRMQKHGLLALLNKRTGLRQIHVRDAEWIAAKEAELGVSGKREANIAEARRHADEYQAWIARELASWATDETDDELADWNPAPAKPKKLDADLGQRLPRAHLSWGGLTDRE